MSLGLLFLAALPGRAADPDIDPLLQSPVGKDWVTNGGNLTNQRYSTLKQIDTTNVKQLKGAWITHLKGSGLGGKYSFEATPVVKDGIMYISTGNDDVFALNAKTGEIRWERWSGIDQKLTSVCCGWDNRGVAIGEGMVFLGQLDANVVALATGSQRLQPSGPGLHRFTSPTKKPRLSAFICRPTLIACYRSPTIACAAATTSTSSSPENSPRQFG